MSDEHPPKIKSKIDFIFNSIYAMLIPNLFIYYLFNILRKDFFYSFFNFYLFFYFHKEGCRNKVFSSYSMPHYNKPRYHFY